MRTPLVAGNWKMNGSRVMARELAGAIAAAPPAGVEILLCPPVSLLETVAQAVAGSAIAVGGQDVSEYDSGAYTGETAASMLAEFDCRYVIVGHSERRQYFGDTDERVAAKAAAAHAARLAPIVCVGETLAERQAGTTEAVVCRQLDAVLALGNINDLLPRMVLAYEPVWAIGTGETATPAEAQAVHEVLRQRLAASAAEAAGAMRILYGGSVKPDNASELFQKADIDGGLIGGASLKADSFLAICAHAA